MRDHCSTCTWPSCSHQPASNSGTKHNHPTLKKKKKPHPKSLITGALDGLRGDGGDAAQQTVSKALEAGHQVVAGAARLHAAQLLPRAVVAVIHGQGAQSVRHRGGKLNHTQWSGSFLLQLAVVRLIHTQWSWPLLLQLTTVRLIHTQWSWPLLLQLTTVRLIHTQWSWPLLLQLTTVRLIHTQWSWPLLLQLTMVRLIHTQWSWPLLLQLTTVRLIHTQWSWPLLLQLTTVRLIHTQRSGLSVLQLTEVEWTISLTIDNSQTESHPMTWTISLTTDNRLNHIPWHGPFLLQLTIDWITSHDVDHFSSNWHWSDWITPLEVDHLSYNWHCSTHTVLWSILLKKSEELAQRPIYMLMMNMSTWSRR